MTEPPSTRCSPSACHSWPGWHRSAPACPPTYLGDNDSDVPYAFPARGGSTGCLAPWCSCVSTTTCDPRARSRGCFDFRGLIMYRLGEGELFTDIKVAYNSFTHTSADGAVRELGAPH